MSEFKRSSQLRAMVPLGVIGLLGVASAALGQTFIGANAGNGWNASANIVATASDSHSVRVPANLISGVNLDPTGTLSAQPGLGQPGVAGSDWLSLGGGLGAPDPTGLPYSAWVEFTFDQSYTLGGILIWQNNQKPYPYSYQGMQDCTIQTSNDGTHWTTAFVGAIPAESDGGAPNYYEPLSLTVNTGGISAQYVVITAATTNWDYATNGDTAVALNAVMFQTSPVPEPTSIALLSLAGFGLLSRRRA